VARPADAVATQAATDQARRLERAQLLEHAGPAGSHPIGDLIRGSGPARSEGVQNLTTERGRGAGAGRRRHERRHGVDSLDDLGVGAVLEGGHGRVLGSIAVPLGVVVAGLSRV